MKIEHFIKAYCICSEAEEWLESLPTDSMAYAWEHCERPDWLCHVIVDVDFATVSQEEFIELICKIVRESTTSDGRILLDLIEDIEVRNTIDFVLRYLQGGLPAQELDAVINRANDYVLSLISRRRLTGTALGPGYTAASVVLLVARGVQDNDQSRRIQAVCNLIEAIYVAAYVNYTGNIDSFTSSRRKQCDIIRSVIANPFDTAEVS